jgi:hypothetical protein
MARHGDLDAFGEEGVDGFDGFVEEFGDEGQFVAGEVLQDVGGGGHLAGRPADTQAQARELLPQVDDDGLHAIVAAGAAFLAQAQRAEGQIQFVVDDQDVGRGDFVEIDQGPTAVPLSFM